MPPSIVHWTSPEYDDVAMRDCDISNQNRGNPVKTWSGLLKVDLQGHRWRVTGIQMEKEKVIIKKKKKTLILDLDIYL